MHCRKHTFHRLSLVILDFLHKRLLRLLVHALIEHVNVALCHASLARRLTADVLPGQVTWVLPDNLTTILRSWCAMAYVSTIITVKSGALTLKLGTICAAWENRREVSICHFRAAKFGHAMHCNCCNGQHETRGTMLPAANIVLPLFQKIIHSEKYWYGWRHTPLS